MLYDQLSVARSPCPHPLNRRNRTSPKGYGLRIWFGSGNSFRLRILFGAVIGSIDIAVTNRRDSRLRNRVGEDRSHDEA